MTEIITAFGTLVGLCYWDGSAWQKVEEDSLAQGAHLYYWDGDSWEKVEAGVLAQPARLMYWDGSAWQKVAQEQLLGFESIVEVDEHEADADTGTNYLTSEVVTTGKVWKITQAHVVYTGTVPTRAEIYAKGLGGDLRLLYQTSPASGQYYMWSGKIWLVAGNYMYAEVTGATSGDDIKFSAAGVQMDAP